MPTITLWHGTDEVFDEFDFSGCLGVHFGTHDAALERLKATGRVLRADGSPARPQAYEVTILRALHMEDLGTWSFSGVMRELKLNKVITAEQVNEAYDHWNRSDAEGWGFVRQVMKAAGFDGVVYSNAVEDRGSDSWIALDQSQIVPLDPQAQGDALIEQAGRRQRNGLPRPC